MVETVGNGGLFEGFFKLILHAVYLVLHLLQVIPMAALQLGQLEIDLLQHVVISALHDSAPLFFLPLAAFSDLLQQSRLQSFYLPISLLQFIRQSFLNFPGHTLSLLHTSLHLFYLKRMILHSHTNFPKPLQVMRHLGLHFLHLHQLPLEELQIVSLSLVLLVFLLAVLLQQPHYFVQTHDLHLHAFHPQLQSYQCPCEELLYFSLDIAAGLLTQLTHRIHYKIREQRLSKEQLDIRRRKPLDVVNQGLVVQLVDLVVVDQHDLQPVEGGKHNALQFYPQQPVVFWLVNEVRMFMWLRFFQLPLIRNRMPCSEM